MYLGIPMKLFGVGKSYYDLGIGIIGGGCFGLIKSTQYVL